VQDYKLDELLIDTSCRGLVDQVQTEELKVAVGAFVQNINRIAALAQLPVNLFYWGSVVGQNYVVAYQDVTKKMYEFSTPADSFADKNGLIDERERHWTSELLKRFERDKEDWTEVAKDTYKQLLRLLPSEVPLSEGTEAILFSVVIGAWTAFETLASDVWIGAYDALPTAVRGAQDGDQLRIENGMESDPGADVPKARKSAAKFGSDGHLSGEEFVDENRVQFSSLPEMRQHYSRLFSEKLGRSSTDRIDKVLGDTGLDAINAVRNLMVHQSGICDPIYRKKSKNNSLAPDLELGKPLKLDGISALSLVGVVTKLGPELVKAVDAWTQTAMAQ
jgi:hypothetical protein